MTETEKMSVFYLQDLVYFKRAADFGQYRPLFFRPMLGAQGLWAGRDLYRATPTVTRDLGFSGLIRRTAPFRRLLRHTRGCGGPILTQVLTGPLHLSNLDTIYWFVEQKSFPEVRQSLLKTAKNHDVDVAWRHGAAISYTFWVYLEKDPNANI
jgi:hypothetical protein